MLKLFFRACKDTVSVARGVFIAEYLAAICDSVFMVLSIIAMRSFFFSIEQWLNGSQNLSSVIISLGVFAIVKIVDEIFDGLANLLGEYYSSLSLKGATSRLITKTNQFDASNFENHDFILNLNRAVSGAIEVRNVVHTFMDFIAFYLPYFILMGLLFSQSSTTLISLIPLMFIPVGIAQLLRSKLYIDYNNTTSKLQLKEEHYKECLINKIFVRDIIANWGSREYESRYKYILQLKQKIATNTAQKNIRIESLSNTITIFGITSVILFLVFEALQGKINIPSLAAFIASIFEMYSIMKEIFAYRFNELIKSYSKVKDYYYFLNLDINEKPVNKRSTNHAIELKDVSFSYPNSKKEAISSVSLKVEKGKKYAVVGMNGSGKSTLANIILGIYRPDSGNIFYNNCFFIAKSYSETLIEKATCVFQIYGCYNMSIEENVNISVSQQESDSQKVESVLEISGLFNKNNRDLLSLNTSLGKEFGGIELSRGEWQKIAIARALYKDHDLIVLDEPTAAIDPVEEDRLYTQFYNMLKGKTAIIITHRLGAVKLADEIIVLQNGKIIDIGTHLDLKKRCLHYLELWNAQANYWD